MGVLDHYDHDGIVKWHHFAFRADVARVRELRDALEQWTTWREKKPLQSFVRKHHTEWQRRFVEDRAGPVEPRLFAPLLESAQVAGVDVELVRENIEKHAVAMTKLALDGVRAFPGRLGRLARLREIDAPAEIIEHELRRLRDTLLFRAMNDRAAPEQSADAPEEHDDDEEDPEREPYSGFRGLFESAIEVAIVDPWPENVGLWRLLGVVDGVPVPAGVSLIDEDWPVHHQNLERGELCAYGSEGFDILVTFADDDHEALRDERAAVAAYVVDDNVLYAFALDRLQRALDEEGAWHEPDDDDGDGDDDDDDIPESDRYGGAGADSYERGQRIHAERLAPERADFFFAQVRAEWSARQAAMLAAVDDVIAGRCALLQWSAKNPAL